MQIWRHLIPLTDSEYEGHTPGSAHWDGSGWQGQANFRWLPEGVFNSPPGSDVLVWRQLNPTAIFSTKKERI